EDGVGLLGGADDLVLLLAQGHAPGLVGHGQHARGRRVAVRVVGIGQQRVAAVVVDGVHLLALRVDGHARGEAQPRARPEYLARRLRNLVRGSRGGQVVGQQRVPVLVAHHHAAVHGIDGQPVEGREGVVDGAYRLVLAAERARGPLVVEDVDGLRGGLGRRVGRRTRRGGGGRAAGRRV